MMQETKNNSVGEPEVYSTSDQHTIKTLMLLKHFPLQVKVEGDHQCVYLFDKVEVDPHLKMIQTNRLTELACTIADWVLMEFTWTSNLRRAMGGRK